MNVQSSDDNGVRSIAGRQRDVAASAYASLQRVDERLTKAREHVEQLRRELMNVVADADDLREVQVGRTPEDGADVVPLHAGLCLLLAFHADVCAFLQRLALRVDTLEQRAATCAHKLGLVRPTIGALMCVFGNHTTASLRRVEATPLRKVLLDLSASKAIQVNELHAACASVRTRLTSLEQARLGHQRSLSRLAMDAAERREGASVAELQAAAAFQQHGVHPMNGSPHEAAVRGAVLGRVRSNRVAAQVARCATTFDAARKLPPLQFTAADVQGDENDDAEFLRELGSGLS